MTFANKTIVLLVLILLLGRMTAFSADTAVALSAEPAVSTNAVIPARDRESVLNSRLAEINAKLPELQKQVKDAQSAFKRISMDARSLETAGLMNNPEIVKLRQEYEALEKQQLEIKEKMKQLMGQDADYKATAAQVGESGKEMKDLYAETGRLVSERKRIMSELNSIALEKNNQSSVNPASEKK